MPRIRRCQHLERGGGAVQHPAMRRRPDQPDECRGLAPRAGQGHRADAAVAGRAGQLGRVDQGRVQPGRRDMARCNGLGRQALHQLVEEPGAEQFLTLQRRSWDRSGSTADSAEPRTLRNRSISREKSVRECRVGRVAGPDRQERLDGLPRRERPLGQVGEDHVPGPRPSAWSTVVSRTEPTCDGRHDLDLPEDRINLRCECGPTPGLITT